MARTSVDLNLSRRPFLNTRPVSRVALLLWVLGGLLLLGNVTLFWNYLSGSTEKREELVRMEEQVEREGTSIRKLEADLAGFDLAQQNDQVEFLNRKIGERTFSWSLLFDRLTEALPNDVRIIQLQPAAIGGGVERTRPRTRTDAERAAPLASDRVPLVIAAEAKSDEDMNQFIDNLFGHPSFSNPNFTKESRSDEGNRIQFSVHVTYLPRNPTPGMTVEEEPEVVEEAPGAPPAAVPIGPPAASGESEPK